MAYAIRIEVGLLCAVLLGGARDARAQPLPDLEVSRVEVSLAVTFNSVAPVINTVPRCVELSAPCTAARDLRFSGIGVVAGIARNFGKKWAVAGEISTHPIEWDGLRPTGGFEVRSTRVTSFLAGPRIATEFLSGSRRDQTIGRFFGQVLVGGETSAVLSLRPAVLVGGGADFAIPPVARGAPGSRPVLLRWSLDYRFSPGERRLFSGYRFSVGVLFGPKLK